MSPIESAVTSSGAVPTQPTNDRRSTGTATWLASTVPETMPETADRTPFFETAAPKSACFFSAAFACRFVRGFGSAIA